MSKTTKSDAIPFVTPFGVAKYPKISKPDTEGKFADGKFKTYIEFDAGDLKVVEGALKEAAVKFHGTAEDITLPIKTIINRETGEVRFVGVELKSKFRPAVFDSKKKKLPEGAVLGGGSEIRVASALFPWEKAEKVKVKDASGKVTIEDAVVRGVSMRLGDVQVRKLMAGSGAGTGDAFDMLDEGFEYDGSEDGSRADQFDASAL